MSTIVDPRWPLYKPTPAIRSYWDYKPGDVFVEFWENQMFNRLKFQGRTGSFYESEYSKEDYMWTTPPILPQLNTVVAAPWNNVLDMTNTLGGFLASLLGVGIKPDEVYVGVPLAFQKAKFHLDANFPTPALAAMYGAGIQLNWGFEVIGARQHCFYGLMFSGGPPPVYALYCNTLGAGGLLSTTQAVLINNPDVFAEYYLMLDPPNLRFYQQAAALGAIAETNTLSRHASTIGDDWVAPFVSNESAVILPWFLGRMQVSKFS